MILQLTKSYSKIYRAEIISDNGDSVNKISYNAYVNAVNVNRLSGYTVNLTLTDFLVNGESPDIVFEQLVYKCRQAFKDMVFTIAPQGYITGLENYKEVTEKWIDIKEQLHKEYTGDTFESYIAKFEKVIFNQNAFLIRLKRDIFINQFFVGLYNEAFTDYKKRGIERLRFFNIDYEAEVLFKVTDSDAEDNIRINKSIDRDRYNNDVMPIESYAAEYILNNAHEIEQITGTFVNHGKTYTYTINEQV